MGQKMDVCVITTIHPPYEARIYARCVEAYLRHDLRVCLISTWPVPPTEIRGLEWIHIPRARKRWERPLNAFRFFLKALRVPTKAYHFHELDFVVYGALLRLLTRRKVIFDCHEAYKKDIIYNKQYIPISLRRILGIVVDSVEMTCSRIIGNVIVPVPALEKPFVQKGIRVTTVHNYTRWTIQKDCPHENGIVYSGSMTLTYGSRVILEIARSLKRRGLKMPLYLTERNASAAMKNEVRKAVENENLNIVVLPFLKAPDIGMLMRLGHIGLSVMKDSPEKRVSIAAKLFEYMAFGLPIIGESFGYTLKIIRESGCGLLADPEDPETYVDAIERLNSSPREWEQRRQNGFLALENTYSWEKEESRLLSFYGGAVSNIT
jgi:glycosyltransferase involved in cell wall biosynthesis